VGTGFLVRFPTLLDHDGLVFIGSTCCAYQFAVGNKDGGWATMQRMSVDSSDDKWLTPLLSCLWSACNGRLQRLHADLRDCHRKKTARSLKTSNQVYRKKYYHRTFCESFGDMLKVRIPSIINLWKMGVIKKKK
jgi:hypothetical protein